jgi:hypothetical protein
MKLSALLLALVLTVVSCAESVYIGKTKKARRQFENGKYDKALAWYQKQNPPGRDRLLYLMDEALILHTMGRYQDSIKAFSQAIRLSEEMDHAQPLSKTTSILANDNIIPYKGEKYERLLMQVFQVINYLGLGQNQEALVEVRRINTKFRDPNAFSLYLSALVWETQNLFNDAYIDYKKAYRIMPSFPNLPQDLLRNSRLLGFQQDYNQWKKTFKEPEKQKNSRDGDVVFLIEQGTVPRKRSTEESFALQVIPIPYYPNQLEKPTQATVYAKREEMAQSEILYRIDEAAKATLADEKPAIIARAIARLAAKEAGAVVVGQQVDQNLGILLGILVLATNQADLRSWLTLPQSLQIARFPLPAGTYDLKLLWPGGAQEFKQVQIKTGQKTFLTQRCF